MQSPVYIVGAGPGDPGMLTLRAHHLLTQVAEVVVHDRLIAKEILALLPPHVERIYAGKSPGDHCATQEEIHNILLTQVQRGKKVVRLKGGDPLLFSRGGEEIAFLAGQGIPCEIVPGISAAMGISARLGIPLTHRDLATGVRVITGHRRNNLPPDMDWKTLADPATTLVVYMGLATLGIITEKLIEAGLDPSTPAIAVQNATQPGEHVCRSTIAALAGEVERAGLTSPSTVIIGRVCGETPNLPI